MAEMTRTCSLAIALALAAPGFAQAPRLRGEFELNIGAGFSMAQGSIAQRQNWASGVLAGASIENTVSVTNRSALFLGGCYTNFFTDHLGIQVGFGYLKSPLEAQTDFRRAASGVPSRRLAANPDRSELAAVPFYAALAMGWRGKRTGIILTAGPAVILHSLLIEAQMGTLFSEGGAPAAYRVSAAVPDQTWAAFGGLLGATLDFKIGEKTALAFDARYVLSPVKKFAWSWTAETAIGLDDSAARAAFDASAAGAAAAGAPRVSLNSSFLQVSLGIKFRLGSI
jgi:hypothetical protein